MVANPLSTAHSLHRQGKLHKKVSILLGVMAVIVIIAGSISLYDIATGRFGWFTGFLLFISSLIFGLWVSRINRVDWSPSEELIVTQRMDWVSGFLLACYLVVRLASETAMESSYHSASAAFAGSLIVLTGISLGRLVGMSLVVQRTYASSQPTSEDTPTT